FVAVLLPAVVLVYLAYERLLPFRYSTKAAWVYGALYAVTAAAMWATGPRWGAPLNWLLMLVRRMRRKIRPWLRRRGIDLLPPRRRRRPLSPGGPFTREPDKEILAIHRRHRDRSVRVWRTGKPWARQVGGVVITVAIFF